MSTKLKVVFSGVLGFVKHPTKESSCVLMCDALVGTFRGPGWVDSTARVDEAVSTVDGHGLARHFGFLRIPAVHLGQDERSEMVRYLHRERVRFTVAGAKPGRPWKVGDVLRLADVTGTSCAVDPTTMAATPPASILAQVVLDGGHLEVTASGGPWAILDPLGGTQRPPRPFPSR